MRRIALIVLMLGVLVLPAAAQTSDTSIDVVEISGPMDAFSVRYAIDAIEQAAEQQSEMVILKIDSPGSLTADVADLIALVQDAPLPIVAWIGDAPATARGGSLQLALAAQITIAAPGAEIGFGDRALIGESESGDGELTVVSAPIPGVIDDVQAALGPLIVSLHGVELEVAGRTVALDTAVETVDDAGEVRNQVAHQVRFSEPGLWALTMRLGITPEAAFFFLVVGLAFAAFEFYAIGPGLAAATAVVPILLAGYGLASMPFGWGLPIVLLAMWLLAVDYQRGGFGVVSYAATGLLLLGGFFFAGTRPQMPPSSGAVVATTVFALLFFMFAMPTVARSRFTTQTIGRDYLIGAHGRAVTDVSGAGIVELDGAQWQAISHREAGIRAGSTVVVDAIQGMYLEVSPLDREKDT